jgi:hypothetical protein
MKSFEKRAAVLFISYCGCETEEEFEVGVCYCMTIPSEGPIPLPPLFILCFKDG